MAKENIEQQIPYRVYDNLGSSKSKSKVMDCLKKEAKTANKVAEETGLDRTTVFYHLKNLLKKNIVSKKFIGKEAFYGLLLKHR